MKRPVVFRTCSLDSDRIISFHLLMPHGTDVRDKAMQTVSTHNKKMFRNVRANTVSSTKKKVDAGGARLIVHALRDPNLKNEGQLHTKYFLSGGATS